MKTTKKENLKNYLLNACQYRAEDYEMQAPKDFEQAREMIKTIFENEKGKTYKTPHGKFESFSDWIFGLCFCSPIAEDLTPYTRVCNNIIMEQNVVKDIFNLVYYGV